MIDENRTAQLFGYTSDELKPKSNKKIVVVCDGCGTYRVVVRAAYREMCSSCAGKDRPPISEETRRKLSEAKKNISDETRAKMSGWQKDKMFSTETKRKMSEAAKNRSPISEETRLKMSESHTDPTDETRQRMSKAHDGRVISDETRTKLSEAAKARFESADARAKISEANRGKTLSEEHRIKLSCAKQGITISEWDGFAVESKYCPKFNEACKERNREKYDRLCFLSNATEAENGKKLSVHHVDMNKQQGCDNHVWQLVPLCTSYHSRAHTKMWRSRIEYLLKHVWVVV